MYVYIHIHARAYIYIHCSSMGNMGSFRVGSEPLAARSAAAGSQKRSTHKDPESVVWHPMSTFPTMTPESQCSLQNPRHAAWMSSVFYAWCVGAFFACTGRRAFSSAAKTNEETLEIKLSFAGATIILPACLTVCPRSWDVS